MSKDTFEMLRPKIDEAIRAGLSLKEFLELHEINRNVWYTIKPKTFHWREIQNKLGVERKIQYTKKPGPKPIKLNNKNHEKQFEFKDNFYTHRAIEVSKEITRTLEREGFTTNIKPLMLEFGMLQKFINANVCD